MIDDVIASKGRKFAEGMQLNFFSERHHLLHQALIGFTVIAQVMSHHRDFRSAVWFMSGGQFGKNGFGCHINTVVNNAAAPHAIQTVERVGHMLAGRDKLAAKR